MYNPASLPQLINKSPNSIIVLSGVSGSGKDYIIPSYFCR